MCIVILDGSSSENIFSKEELKLATEKYPTHTRVVWFRKGNIVLVTYCCLIKFIMGDDIEDGVWVMCLWMHVAFYWEGRSLYDKDMIHYINVNTYSFQKG